MFQVRQRTRRQLFTILAQILAQQHAKPIVGHLPTAYAPGRSRAIHATLDTCFGCQLTAASFTAASFWSLDAEQKRIHATNRLSVYKNLLGINWSFRPPLLKMVLRLESLVFLVLSCGAALLGALASPVSGRAGSSESGLASRSVTVLTSDQLSALAPYTQLARAAYCPSSLISGWSCGQACQAITGFQPTLTGGDGNAVQLFFVGYWPSQNSVVVSHEGTDPTQFLSLLTDADIVTENLDSSLFPGISSSIYVHSGFADQHAKTASTILAEVNRLISTKGATTVTLVGHSLGGALAELDALFLTLNLPSSIHIKAVTYGTPRVGNPAYATFFDSKVSDFERINNEKDIIPIVPGRGLGFQHPHGEIHIVSPNNVVACSGDDDATDSQCTIATVPNIFVGDILDHLGPYQGIYIGTIYCT